MTVSEPLVSLTGAAGEYDSLLARAAGSRVILIGEASHGTREFYRERAEITKRLIAEGAISAVTAEADWPDAYRVNRYVRGENDDRSPEEALSDFRRFPSWMWHNVEVVEFIAWLRGWNDALPARAAKVGFYGLDLYSLHASMEAVVDYLEEVDPAVAERARKRYSCFDHFGPDPQTYAYKTAFGGSEPCERQAVEQLVELRNAAAGLASQDEHADDDRRFYAEQNARLVVNAEQYYRAVFWGGAESWNLRDQHMAETLQELITHLERRSGPTGAGSLKAGPAKVVVWAHNSHIGDARATELGQKGELNVGQISRQHYGHETLLIGFTTYTGTVTAASEWGGTAERKHVRPALRGSWEAFFHEKGEPRFLLDPRRLAGGRLERAIGVIYRPETERLSHYFQARLREQFDAIIHIDETHANEPLERTSVWEKGELPETYPWAV
ncbi:MAG: erythromycin esterase family protein [Gaiellaceae bacterium]